MPDYPPWQNQTLEQKLDFLHEWLVNTDSAIRRLQADNQGLFERLRKVEADRMA